MVAEDATGECVTENDITNEGLTTTERENCQNVGSFIMALGLLVRARNGSLQCLDHAL